MKEHVVLCQTASSPGRHHLTIVKLLGCAFMMVPIKKMATSSHEDMQKLKPHTLLQEIKNAVVALEKTFGNSSRC